MTGSLGALWVVFGRVKVAYDGDEGADVGGYSSFWRVVVVVWFVV